MPAPVPISPRRPTSMGPWWLRNRWHNLSFVHWPYAPEHVARLLPPGLEPDVFDGRAWVSLVPFEMRDAAPRGLPSVGAVSDFAETNVRTYVVDSRGNRAVWFCSLEATSLPIVAFARAALGFPYVWADMTVHAGPGVRGYTTRGRRWPRRPAATTRVELRIGDILDEPDPLDHFLTARWGTVARWPTRPQGWGRLRYHPVDHPAWTLRSATLTEYDDTSIRAAGLPEPTGEPIVRWVDSIEARFGAPQRV